MAYKRTYEASLRKHDSNTKVKKPEPRPVAAPSTSQSPARSVAKTTTPLSNKPSTKAPTAPTSTGRLTTKVASPPDRPISPNRKSSRGSIRVGPATVTAVPKGRAVPTKGSSQTVVGKDVTDEYSKTGLGRVVKKSRTPRPKKYKLK